MTLDEILNATWLLLGLCALVALQPRLRSDKSRVFCCVGVVLIFATLFPVISATDDLIRMQHLERVHKASHDSGTSSHKRAIDSLIRLYEAMDSPLASKPVGIVFTVFFSFLTVQVVEAYARRRAIAESGRSPPSCLA